jgi:hypothetical protein
MPLTTSVHAVRAFATTMVAFLSRATLASFSLNPHVSRIIEIHKATNLGKVGTNDN